MKSSHFFKSLAIIPLALTLFIIFPFITHAEETGKCGENITYHYSDDGVLTFTGTGPMDNYILDPMDYDGPLTTPPYDSYLTSVHKIVIEEGITKIGNAAFPASSLEGPEIILPSTLVEIGNDAFYSNRMKSIVLPDGLKKIGNYAFEGCNNIEEIVIPDSVISLGEYAFFSCKSLKKVTLSEGITKLRNSTFSYCKALEDINLPYYLEDLSPDCFYECSSIKKLIVPPYVKELYPTSFYLGNKDLELYIPGNFSNINFIRYGKLEPHYEEYYKTQIVYHYYDGNTMTFDHTMSDYVTTQAATALKTGIKKSACHCGYTKLQTIPKLKPTIKVSKTNITLKKKHSYLLKISNLAKGDSVSSVKLSKKSIASVKRTKKNCYKIVGKKRGSTTITVKLKSGKTKKCKLKVK